MSDKQKLFAEKNKLFSEKNRFFAEKNKVFAESCNDEVGAVISRYILDHIEDLIDHVTREENGEELSAEDYKAYTQKAKCVTSALTPLIDALVSARLFQVTIGSSKYLKKKYRMVGFPVKNAYADVGFDFFVESEAHSIMLAMDNGHPNIGNGGFEEYSRELHRLSKGPKKPYKIWREEHLEALKSKFADYQKMLREQGALIEDVLDSK